MGNSTKSLIAGSIAVLASTTMTLAADIAPPPIIEHQPVVAEPVVGGNWYLRGDIGIGIVDSGRWHQPDVTAANGAFLNHDLGTQPFIGIGFGYRFNEWFRADVTGQFRGSMHISAVDQYQFNNGVTVFPRNNFWRGSIWSAVALVNGYVDLGNWHGFSPYIGAGVGVAHNRVYGLTDWDTSGLGGGGRTRDNGKSNFAWALHGGLAYDVNEALTLEAGYSYTHLGDAESGALVCYPTTVVCDLGAVTIKDLRSHDLRLGMRWNFLPKVLVEEPIVRKF